MDCRLCCDWSMGSIPLITGLEDPRNAFTAVVFGVAVAGAVASLRRARAHPTASFELCVLVSLCTTAVTMLPATNMFFVVGFVIAERVLYLPSLGLSLLVGAAVALLTPSSSSSTSTSTSPPASQALGPSSGFQRALRRHRRYHHYAAFVLVIAVCFFK